jgi:CheY-like chemotaxis protein
MNRPNRTLAGRTILVVEDDPLLALEVRSAFSAAGASIMSAADSSKALRMLSSSDLSAAVVDINLGRGDDCSAVCDRLSDRRIPFVFYTGDVRADILLKWPGSPLLTKLADKERVVGVVAGMLR